MRWLTWMLVLLALGSARAAESTAGPDVRCGSYCLYVALDALGSAPADFDALESLLGPPGSAGYSLAQLQAIAEKQGVQTVAVETSLENLKDRGEKFACLTLVNDNHFVLLYDVAGDRVAIIDPPRSYELSRSTFEGIWSKKALLLSTAPLSAEESIVRWRRFRQVGLWSTIVLVVVLIGGMVGARVIRRFRPSSVGSGQAALLLLTLFLGGCQPESPSRTDPPDSQEPPSLTRAATSTPALSLEPARLDLGRIHRLDPSQTVEASTTIHNRGSRPVEIQGITTSCDCTSAKVSSHSLPPGDSVALTASIRLGDTIEPRSTHIQIRMTDPDIKPLAWVVDWQVRNPIATRPRSFNLPQLSPNAGAERTADVFLDGMVLCPRCQVRAVAGSKLFSCRLEEAPYPRAESHGIMADREAVDIGKLLISIPRDDEEGFHRDHVRIDITCEDQLLAQYVLPISWSVTPPLQAIPPRLSLGTTKSGALVAQKLLLRSKRGGLFQVKRVSCDQPGILKDARFPDEPDLTQTLDITVSPPSDPGIWRTQIHIETSHPEAPILNIPISALIE